MSDGRPLRIGLDIGWFAYPTAEGIYHWTLQTFRALIRDNPRHHFTLVWPHPHADPKACDLLAGPNTELFVVRPLALWRRVGRRLGVLSGPDRVVRRLGRLDVIHWAMLAETCYPWLHRLPGVPTAITAYDAIPIALPETQLPQGIMAWARYVARAREVGSWWLAISEHARSDMVKYGKLDPARACVVPPGHNFDGSDGRTVADADLPPDLTARLGGSPYVLTVGALEPRKNHVRLFRAFRQLTARPEFAHWKLVVVGGSRGELGEPIVAEGEATPGVILAGRLDQEQLAACYRHAAVFASPSLYEGFGLPVAEAMSFGRAVLTSTTTSLPEVAGDAAVLVDPDSEDAIRDGLARLMADPDLRAGLGAAARKQVARFNWSRAARETMAFLERVAASRGPGRQA
jgi:glycosyltransferase involved in cell wall biosynthesis